MVHKTHQKAIYMITDGTVSSFKTWFDDYTKSFYSGNPQDQQNIELKEFHTRRVCKEILDVGNALDLNGEDLNLAEVMALFHDIGRFEQYARYGTFSDLKSEDHAILGVKVLRKTGVLEMLGPSTADLILRCIAYHNRAFLPEDESVRCLFFARLLRDADKLDILRVVTDYYQRKTGDRNGAIELDLPDTLDISPEIYEDLLAKKIVKTEYLKTLNDFKLLQMGWVFDVNFLRTFQLIQERHYIEMIRDALPRSKKISEIYVTVRSYLEEHAKNVQGSTGSLNQ
jgi:putative nucleotidyltransferase with HDIG domain